MGNKSTKSGIIANGRACDCSAKQHCCKNDKCLECLGSMIQIQSTQSKSIWRFSDLHKQSLMTALERFDRNIDFQSLISIINMYLNNAMDIYLVFCHGVADDPSISICDKWYKNISCSQDIKLKVVILGQVGIGKTSLAVRFVIDQFFAEMDPTIEDSYKRLFDINEKTVLFDILDNPEHDPYLGGFDHLYHVYHEGQIFLVSFAINSKQGLAECKSKLDEIRRRCDIVETNPSHDCEKCVILVATKLDLFYNNNDDNNVDSKVLELMKKNQEEGIKLSKLWNIPYIETSSKDNINIDLLFRCIVYKVLDSNTR